MLNLIYTFIFSLQMGGNGEAPTVTYRVNDWSIKNKVHQTETFIPLDAHPKHRLIKKWHAHFTEDIHLNPLKTSTLQIEVAAGRSRDTDGDGVKDNSDVCAETPENTTVGKMGCPVGGIYFDKNEATIGESYEFNGAIYKVVDENIFRKMIAQGTDVTKVITTHVTNMPRLFHNQPHFNQDISTWDVSQVKDMSYMFGELAKPAF